ncbi:MAG: amidase [Candidatus Dormibacteria bacterium]
MQTMLETSAAVVAGRVSVVELVERSLECLGALKGSCNPCTELLAEDALRRAEVLDAGPPTGPIHGVPVIVKDNFDVVGAVTTSCCEAYMGRPPATADSDVVAALRRAGAVVVAKANQHELAIGTTSLLSSFGPVRNPWALERIAGGSSGGSAAAVAAGAVSFAMGTDTAGSIRVPAALCGVTGLKPTRGAVSMRGVMPLVPEYDTAGAIAHTATDCLAVHRALSGSGGAVRVRPLSELRIGIPRSFYLLVDAEVVAAVEAVGRWLEGRGARIVELDLPDQEPAWEAWPGRWSEMAAGYADLWGDPRSSEEVRRLARSAEKRSPAALARAMQVAARVRAEFETAFQAADLLLTPTVSYPAPLASEKEVAVPGGSIDVHQGGPVRLTAAMNVAGVPALTFPVGLAGSGMPIGAQLCGPAWSEDLICSAAAAFQHDTHWHRLAPGHAGS